MIAVCRHLHIPARYVAGMLLGEGATHAWAEIYFNGSWHAYDPTNNRIANKKYPKICLAPGFLNDHSDQFAWIPFNCKECFHCVLATHKTDNRESLKDFISILIQLYQEAIAFPL